MSVPVLSRLGAIAPLAMLMTALAMVVGHAAVYGIVHEPDEGTPAQYLSVVMAAQIPIVAVFAATWLPRSPRATLRVLLLQALAAVAAVVAVLYLT